MSGPPPCTMIGLSPTYFNSTTSRANSSRSAGSFIAAPPYLITTVLPWNSRMYGSASRRRPTSGRVLGIDPHVVVGQVGEEHLGLDALARQPDLVVDLGTCDGRSERALVVRDHRARAAHLDTLDRDVDGQRRGVGQRHPDGL